MQEVIFGNVPSKSNSYKIIKIGNHCSMCKTPAVKKYEDNFYMQLLAETSEEFGSHKGFGWIQGNVKKIKSSKLPHIGWNDIKVKKKNKIIENLDVYRDFYFVNSFYFHPKKKENVVAETNYGQNFCSIVQKKNIIGVQFHPEKSQKAGQLIIKNFLKMR